MRSGNGASPGDWLWGRGQVPLHSSGHNVFFFDHSSMKILGGPLHSELADKIRQSEIMIVVSNAEKSLLPGLERDLYVNSVGTNEDIDCRVASKDVVPPQYVWKND